MKHLLIGAALLAFSTPVLADGHATVDASTVLATVNGTDITLGHLIALRSRLPEQFLQLPDETLYQGMLDQIVQQQVLTDNAVRNRATEVGLENEMRAFLATRELDRISGQPIDEADVQAAYDARFAGVDPEPEFNASHILVGTEEEAAAIVTELEGGADFATLARERSTGPSGPGGGELGWFRKGMMVPTFEAAVLEMEPGDVSDPVQTQFGWHVITLNDTRAQEIPSLESLRDELTNELQSARAQETMAAMTEEAEIEVFEVEVDPALIRETDLLEN